MIYGTCKKGYEIELLFMYGHGYFLGVLTENKNQVKCILTDFVWEEDKARYLPLCKQAESPMCVCNGNCSCFL